MKISISNRQRRVRFDLPWLRRFAALALPECAKHPARSGAQTALMRLDAVEVIIVPDAEIAALHEQFMGIAGATDVITFEHGEIVIGAGTAERNARDFSQPIEHELALYIIHGLLHLHGHEDHAPADAARMRETQAGILRACLKAGGAE